MVLYPLAMYDGVSSVCVAYTIVDAIKSIAISSSYFLIIYIFSVEDNSYSDLR